MPFSVGEQIGMLFSKCSLKIDNSEFKMVLVSDDSLNKTSHCILLKVWQFKVTTYSKINLGYEIFSDKVDTNINTKKK